MIEIVIRNIVAITLLVVILLALTVTILSLLKARKRVMNQLEIKCKECGKRLAIPHPCDGSRMICSEDYVEGFPYCRDCLIDYCLNTKCSECTVNSKKKCALYSTKKQCMEELVQNSNVVAYNKNGTVTIV